MRFATDAGLPRERRLDPRRAFSPLWLKLALVFLPALAAQGAWAQAGPPFQTDDPTPVDYGHYEFYIFGMVDGTPAELDPTGPAFEFNWGAVPDVQLHAILPFGGIMPSNNPIYAPGGTGPSTFGLTDTELGLKWGFIHQTRLRPQMGTFTMLELPTGNSNKGLGVGRVWYKLRSGSKRSSAPGAWWVAPVTPSFIRRNIGAIPTEAFW